MNKRKYYLLVSIIFIYLFYSKCNVKAKNIYIGDQKQLNSIESISDNDLLILDDRNSSNPNMKIYSSYKINNIIEQYHILNTLYNYENNDPTNWNRSVSSMEIEWILHNILYNFYYKRERTADVDFENDEENIIKLLKKY